MTKLGMGITLAALLFVLGVTLYMNGFLPNSAIAQNTQDEPKMPCELVNQIDTTKLWRCKDGLRTCYLTTHKNFDSTISCP